MSPLLFLILIIFLLIWLSFYQCCYVAETALVLFIFTVALYFLSMCFALCPTFIILSELLTWSEFAFAFLFAKVEAEAMNLCPCFLFRPGPYCHELPSDGQLRFRCHSSATRALFLLISSRTYRLFKVAHLSLKNFEGTLQIIFCHWFLTQRISYVEIEHF